MNAKLQLKAVASIIGASTVTIPRLSTSDKDFPKLERVGRSIFIDEDKFYHWLSSKAGEKITPKDKLLKGKEIQAYYSKSHTWLWQHVKDGNLPKPFKINRTNYWIERDIMKGNV